jgi:hypothetical protein
MTPIGFQRHKDQLLRDKADCDNEMASVKNEITAAKRNYRATGQRAAPEWLAAKEARLAQLKAGSQDFQRQLASLNVHANQPDLAHFVHDILLEQMPREEVALIFKEAIIRRRLHLDGHSPPPPIE